MICAVASKPFRVAVVAMAVASALLALIGWIWYTWDRTIYADDFSQKEFDQVTRGMPEAEVVSRLGHPLTVDEGVRPETWFYDEAVVESDGVSKVFDLFGPTQAVTFDETGLVAKASGDSLQAVSVESGVTSTMVRDLAVTVGMGLLALVLGAATLKRRSA